MALPLAHPPARPLSAPQVKPKQGDALLFWSQHWNGTLDQRSLHGGCPVIKGQKWAMTKWLRSQCFFGGAC